MITSDGERRDCASRALVDEVIAILNTVFAAQGRMALLWEHDDLPVYVEPQPDQPLQ